MKAFALAALCFLIVGLSYAQSQEPSPGKGIKGKPKQYNAAASKKPASQDQRGTEQMPLVIKSIPAEKTPDQAQEDRDERQVKAANERGLTTYTGLLALFTFCLIVVGSVQIGLFIWQLRLIRDSLADTKHAADAANKSADAAERTVTTMKDTAERQMRAYVSVALAEMIDLKAGFTPVAHLRVKNSGQTPAYDLTAIGGIAMGGSFDKLPPPTGPSAMSRSTLHASAITDQFHRTPRPLTPDEIAALVDGTITLWVYGEFRYRDTFSIQRFTKYRFQVGGTAGVHGNNMAICEEGNHET